MKILNLKIYRKLLTLAVLSIGLFIATSVNADRAGTMPCCSPCFNQYDACIASCDSPYAARDCAETCDTQLWQCLIPICDMDC